MFGKKSSENSAKNVFLYSYEYHDKKMGGIKRANNFVKKHKNSASKKCWGKNRRKKCEKRFLYSHKYRYQKMGGKRAKQFFQKNKNSAIKKCWEKIVGKMCEKRFFIFTRILWPKNDGEQNARNNFSRNTLIVRKKKFGKKSSEKMRKTFFYIYTNIVTKKWGRKTRETIFPETQE